LFVSYLTTLFQLQLRIKWKDDLQWCVGTDFEMQVVVAYLHVPHRHSVCKTEKNYEKNLVGTAGKPVDIQTVYANTRCLERYRYNNLLRFVLCSIFSLYGFFLEVVNWRTVKMAIFWVVAPCSLVEVYQRLPMIPSSP
jgi:hypothetical protein